MKELLRKNAFRSRVIGMRLTDARSMRALAHPLRIELFERLAIEGEATASELAPLVGSTPSNCSFHLRTLAEAGFIERVPGHTGRHRPWRVIEVTQNWSSAAEGDEDLAQATTALESSYREWEFERIRQAAAEENPPQWQDAFTSIGSTLLLTPEESRELGDQIVALIDEYVPRWDDPTLRPDDARPVRFYTTSYLVRSAEEKAAGSDQERTAHSTTDTGEEADR